MTNHIIHPLKTHYRKKTVICCEENIKLNLVSRFKKRSDLSLNDHKFDLIYCQLNTRETGAVRNISFLMSTL